MDPAKLNRIDSAYGPHLEYFANMFGIDQNGYTQYDAAEKWREFDAIGKPGAPNVFWRPLVLVGIEHNNNWNKITQDTRPPAHSDEFWIISEGITQSYRGRLQDFPQKITHWQYNKPPLSAKW